MEHAGSLCLDGDPSLPLNLFRAKHGSIYVLLRYGIGHHISQTRGINRIIYVSQSCSSSAYEQGK